MLESAVEGTRSRRIVVQGVRLHAPAADGWSVMEIATEEGYSPVSVYRAVGVPEWGVSGFQESCSLRVLY